MSSWKYLFSILFLLSLLNPLAEARQLKSAPEITLTPESGFQIQSHDKFMGFRLSTRLQQQLGFTRSLDHKEAAVPEYAIRRARLGLHSYFFEHKFSHFVQIQMDKGHVSLLDAKFSWKASERLKIHFGQLWPAGARQFRTSSRNFQLIDRSTVSRYYSLGYDLGILAEYYIHLTPSTQINVYTSITHGEGPNIPTGRGGLAYSSRLEILPFGSFNGKGDYQESDLFMEPTPKISIGGSFHFNKDANLLLGGADQKQAWEDQDNDIHTLSMDILYKHNGFSFFSEFIMRELQQNINPSTNIYSELAGGNGWYIQSGKLIRKDLEPTLRISVLRPNDAWAKYNGSYLSKTTYTIGLNKFLLGHAMKLQSEIKFIDEISTSNNHQWSTQFLTQFSLSF